MAEIEETLYLRSHLLYLRSTAQLLGALAVSWGKIVLVSHAIVSLEADLGGKFPEDVARKW